MSISINELMVLIACVYLCSNIVVFFLVKRADFVKYFMVNTILTLVFAVFAWFYTLKKIWLVLSAPEQSAHTTSC